MRSRNAIWILNGAIGCGFGVVLVALVLRWFPKTIRGLWFVDIILRSFVVFSRSGVSSEHPVRSRNPISFLNDAVG